MIVMDINFSAVSMLAGRQESFGFVLGLVGHSICAHLSSEKDEFCSNFSCYNDTTSIKSMLCDKFCLTL